MIPATIADLAPAPYNPRTIDGPAMQGLQASIKAFGDISGIVFNTRTGHLVAGHQRIEALKQTHKLVLEGVDGTLAVVTDTGTRFPIRLVDWDEDIERAANLAANNPHIAGRFTEALGPMLTELEMKLPELTAGLRLGELKQEAIYVPPPGGEPADGNQWAGMPEFQQNDLSSWKAVLVHFAGPDEMMAFAKLVGQSLTEKIRSIWYPAAEIVHYADKRYVDES